MARILSGIKPTGSPTLGNYIGALRNFVTLQKEHADDEFFMFVADMHAITVPQDPDTLRANVKSVAALYLASGMSTHNLSLFVQSEVPAHVCLGDVMQSITYMGELERMTQFKEKKEKQTQGVSSALFTYPPLMAADILLYNPKYVPVGEDQTQHLELTRLLANRFNTRFGETFVVPECLITKTGARIMDLQDPLKKMSKSESDKGCIALLEPLNVIKKKVMSAVTDSEMSVHYDKANKPGISNLMQIHASLSGMSLDEIETRFQGHMYGDFKKEVAELVLGEIAPLQERYNKLINSTELDDILDSGRAHVEPIANAKLQEVYHKMGIGRH